MPDFAEVEWLARTEAVQVRINTLGPDRSTPWHFHGAVTDDVFCLEEGLRVDLRDPAASAPLRPGERVTIAPRRIHRIVNTTARPLRYLLVQATGAYDFHEVA
jgi:mannose-6-phosphate isomerase-like protein (cupin superfamily)